MSKIVIQVTDVNGQSIDGCQIEVSDDQGGRMENTSSPGGVLKWSTTASRLNILAAHPSFASQAMRVALTPPGWDLPTAVVHSASGTTTITVPLSRLVRAPTYQIDKARLKVAEAPPKASVIERTQIEKRNDANLKALNEEVTGILSERREDGREYYLWTSGKVDQFTAVDPEQQSQRVLTSAKEVGWNRFRTGRTPIDPFSQGQFWILQYGGSLGSRQKVGPQAEKPFLVSVYIPDLPAKPAPPERDMLVFLTPNTNKPEYSVSYPYGLNRAGNDFLQPFIAHLGCGYLFDRHYLVHQLLAERKSTILVMPIWPQDGPGFLIEANGMLRLLREVQNFAHRNGFSGIRLPAIASIPLKVQAPVPSIGRVAIAGFSQGGEYLLQLMNGRYRGGLSPILSVPLNSESQFARTWCEAFDVDCNSSEAFDAALVRWRKGNEQRGIRVLGSGYAGRARKDLDQKGDRQNPLLGSLVTGEIKQTADPQPTINAYEYKAPDGRFSALITTQGFLQPQVNSSTPVFSWNSDPHQFAPTFGIAWALACSSLR